MITLQVLNAVNAVSKWNFASPEANALKCWFCEHADFENAGGRPSNEWEETGVAGASDRRSVSNFAIGVIYIRDTVSFMLCMKKAPGDRRHGPEVDNTGTTGSSLCRPGMDFPYGSICSSSMATNFV